MQTYEVEVQKLELDLRQARQETVQAQLERAYSQKLYQDLSEKSLQEQTSHKILLEHSQTSSKQERYNVKLNDKEYQHIEELKGKIQHLKEQYESTIDRQQSVIDRISNQFLLVREQKQTLERLRSEGLLEVESLLEYQESLLQEIEGMKTGETGQREGGDKEKEAEYLMQSQRQQLMI